MKRSIKLAATILVLMLAVAFLGRLLDWMNLPSDRWFWSGAVAFSPRDSVAKFISDASRATDRTAGIRKAISKSQINHEGHEGARRTAKARRGHRKSRMKPAGGRSGERNFLGEFACVVSCSAAMYPLRTAPSMVAGQPVAVQSPASMTRGHAV
jgi:hypothetical protein